MSNPVEGTDKSTADNKTNEKADGGPEPDLESVRRTLGDRSTAHLSAQLFIHTFIIFRPEFLVEEEQKHRYNDACLESLPENNKENGDCEDVGHLARAKVTVPYGRA